jgi:GNAT superfamily N-acetyltransferase
VLPAWPHAEILEEVLVRPRRAYVPLPDLEVIERAGWMQITTPSFKTGGFNEVAHAVLDEREADLVIDATIAGYRDRGIAFRWAVGPDSAPPDLGDRLARRGLVRSVVIGMARSTSGVRPPLQKVRIEEVDAATVEPYTAVMAEGWSADPGPLLRANLLAVRDPSSRMRLYLARCDGVPAAAAAYVAFPRSAYLLGAVVLPRFRRLGLYRGLVAARIEDARRRGLALATSQARQATSAPLLARLGFQPICQLDIYQDGPQG